MARLLTSIKTSYAENHRRSPVFQISELGTLARRISAHSLGRRPLKVTQNKYGEDERFRRRCRLTRLLLNVNDYRHSVQNGDEDFLYQP